MRIEIKNLNKVIFSILTIMHWAKRKKKRLKIL